MIINTDNFPRYTNSHYEKLMSKTTPIEEHDGFLVKMDNRFNLGGILGGKVRQCLRIVYENIDEIKNIMVVLSVVRVYQVLNPQSYQL